MMGEKMDRSCSDCDDGYCTMNCGPADVLGPERIVVSEVEREKILIRLDPLVQYLGAPGDWGYNTVLGKMTIKLIDLRNRLRRGA